MKLPRYTPEREYYKDADGHDLAQDSRWDDVAGRDFYADPSLETWPRPYRSVWRPTVCREDFDPAGLPSLGEAA